MHKNNKRLLLALLLTPMAVLAQEKNDKAESLSSTPTGIYFGAGVYRHHYEETVLNAFFMSNKGPMRQVELSYVAKTPWQGIYWDVTAASASGDVDYTSDGTGEIAGAQNNMVRYGVFIRHDFPTTSSVTFSPFYGFERRIHEDNKQNLISSTGAYGYHRRSEYNYFPVGLRAQIRVGSNILIMPSLQWNAFYHGRQISDFDIINNQYLGYGYALGVAMDVAMGGGDVVASATYKKWSIDDSSITSYPENDGTLLVREPENTTTETGVSLGYRF